MKKGADWSQLFILLAKLWDYPTNLSPETKEVLEKLHEDLGLSTSEEAFSIKDEELREEYTRLFINTPLGVPAPPFASVYKGGGLLCQKPMEEAMAFYRRAGVGPASENEPADYLPLELAFVAYLLTEGKTELLREFLNKHLLSWFPLFREALLKAQPHQFFVALVSLTEALLSKLNEEVSA